MPSPFPDKGVEVDGTHRFGDVAQIDYAACAVAGFKNSASEPLDLDFTQSHSPYYVDDNARPTVGGRLARTLKASAVTDVLAA